ncbi:hypothetical protein F2P56_028074 [Juglans regia]|uniref:Uncharacterized protein LOC109006116 isoform X2 n=2 Tax=Juglans regia TaxID=51240 RepID=A0A2I4GAA9_JUGRE|nr:uncharacterized protein LOC109006116 isoform X2 [Juglans regia]KAF5453145.1 hypothetical protein F2P56_028074 [Juglans regia]
MFVEMSSQRHHVTVWELVEEGKKRFVVLIICVAGLSYLMSLTSSSVWVNLPAAASLIIGLRYISLDFDMRRKAAAYNSNPSSANALPPKIPLELPKNVENSEWRSKVDSPVVEDAIDHFTRHLVSEWVTDFWYSRLTPDKEGPEELLNIVNGVLGEISARTRNINLIDLLTRDLINLVCIHLELFRATQVKIEKQHSGSLTIEHREILLRHILANENKLHPALFSPEAEHKVLQHLMDGLISSTFKPEDLECLLFRYIARELLASAVMRPVLNLASPRFMNERIESLVLNMSKAKKGALTVEGASQTRSDERSRISSDYFSRFLDPTVTGVELVPLKNNQSRTTANASSTDQDYRKKEGENRVIEQVSQAGKSVKVDRSKAISKSEENNTVTKVNHSDSTAVHFGCTDQLSVESLSFPTNRNISSHSSFISFKEDEKHNITHLEEVESGSSTSYTSEDEETSNVTGLDSPGTKVWDGRGNRNLALSHIHHPLENSEGLIAKKTGKGHIHYQRLVRTPSGRKRSRLSSHKTHIWQEVERTSFLSGDGQDLLSSAKGYANAEDSSDDCENENLGRVQSGAAASSSVLPIPESRSFTVSSLQDTLAVASFFKLRCEVLGANIVKSCSKTFAVYSISVADVDNNSWSIKRRFRHFEELHRRLKEFPEYNLHLPPKRFLSTGLDVPIIQERCKLLDKYLKNLMQLPRISGSIEVWDFLSVDSQTYLFSNSFSIIETLSVDLEDKPSEKSKKLPKFLGPTIVREDLGTENKESMFLMKNNVVTDGRSNAKDTRPQNYASSPSSLENTVKGRDDNGSSESLHDAAADPFLPTEWVPTNLSVPILDLVDVIFQLQDGGWIRRKAFWVAKQILQLGMGDAFDDWLIEKIQLLRKGSVIASGIRQVEKILWPDGIFITKHPKHRPPPPVNPSQNTPLDRQHSGVSPPILTCEQQQEADRRAKFVYELMIDNAPAAIIGLVGRKEYEQCAKDLYFFIQSPVCLKQLAFDLLELLLLSAFPELDYVFKQLQEERHKYVESKGN